MYDFQGQFHAHSASMARSNKTSLLLSYHISTHSNVSHVIRAVETQPYLSTSFIDFRILPNIVFFFQTNRY